MKKVKRVMMMTVLLTMLMSMEVSAAGKKTSVHFAQTHMTVQCVNGIAQDTKCVLHVNCTSKGHYDLAKGNYRSSNPTVATVDKYGTVHCTGKAGFTTISVKYKGKTYRCRISVITPSMPMSMTYGATSNPKCWATSSGDAWATGRLLGKK